VAANEPEVWRGVAMKRRWGGEKVSQDVDTIIVKGTERFTRNGRR